MSKGLRCYAHGSGDQWEAICVDLDISVAGSSLDEVRKLLGECVLSYVKQVMGEAPEDQIRLLNRRAPWHVRAHLALMSAIFMFRRPKDENEEHAGFSLSCPA